MSCVCRGLGCRKLGYWGHVSIVDFASCLGPCHLPPPRWGWKGGREEEGRREERGRRKEKDGRTGGIAIGGCVREGWLRSENEGRLRGRSVGRYGGVRVAVPAARPPEVPRYSTAGVGPWGVRGMMWGFRRRQRERESTRDPTPEMERQDERPLPNLEAQRSFKNETLTRNLKLRSSISDTTHTFFIDVAACQGARAKL